MVRFFLYSNALPVYSRTPITLVVMEVEENEVVRVVPKDELAALRKLVLSGERFGEEIAPIEHRILRTLFDNALEGKSSTRGPALAAQCYGSSSPDRLKALQMAISRLRKHLRDFRIKGHDQLQLSVESTKTGYTLSFRRTARPVDTRSATDRFWAPCFASDSAISVLFLGFPYHEDSIPHKLWRARYEFAGHSIRAVLSVSKMLYERGKTFRFEAFNETWYRPKAADDLWDSHLIIFASQSADLRTFPVWYDYENACRNGGYVLGRHPIEHTRQSNGFALQEMSVHGHRSNEDPDGIEHHFALFTRYGGYKRNQDSPHVELSRSILCAAFPPIFDAVIKYLTEERRLRPVLTELDRRGFDSWIPTGTYSGYERQLIGFQILFDVTCKATEIINIEIQVRQIFSQFPA